MINDKKKPVQRLNLAITGFFFVLFIIFNKMKAHYYNNLQFAFKKIRL